jgi:hypothetical protein
VPTVHTLDLHHLVLQLSIFLFFHVSPLYFSRLVFFASLASQVMGGNYRASGAYENTRLPPLFGFVDEARLGVMRGEKTRGCFAWDTGRHQSTSTTHRHSHATDQVKVKVPTPRTFIRRKNNKNE